jgi:hypothetical protein
MTVKVKREEGSTQNKGLTHQSGKKDYYVTVDARINQVEIRGGNDDHPLYLVEVKVYGGEFKS